MVLKYRRVRGSLLGLCQACQRGRLEATFASPGQWNVPVVGNITTLALLNPCKARRSSIVTKDITDLAVP